MPFPFRPRAAWLCLMLLGAASPALADPPPTPAQQLADAQKRLDDWPELARYRDENATVQSPAMDEARVVFLGDSITDFWGRGDDRGTFFPGKPYINRGIAGQTTGQMLLRFRADVIALKPRAMVLLAGTNDIAGNAGAATDRMIEDNIASICELARASGIKVVLASITPVNGVQEPSELTRRPLARIRALNDWLKRYATQQGLVYLDYYAALADNGGLLRAEFANDGLHPNNRGYAVMAPLAQRAIDKALAH